MWTIQNYVSKLIADIRKKALNTLNLHTKRIGSVTKTLKEEEEEGKKNEKEVNPMR